jgi:predicted AAA+ superfamily ATPase
VVTVRRDIEQVLLRRSASFPAVTITGPRQSGKSTLARVSFPAMPYANLEAPDTRSFAADDPRSFLDQFPEGAVLDEIQRVPHLLSYLQPRIDDDPTPGRWVLTGSQNLALLESVSQSLAGRSALLELLPLVRDEVVRFDSFPTTLDEALLTGGYPRILEQRLDPVDWLAAYVATYVERDVRSVSNVGDLVTYQRMLELAAGRTAQLLNYSALASDVGVSQPTAKAWLSVLETTYVVFRLPAFHANLRKRLVKQPRLHFVDSGLACWLLGIRSTDQLRLHPLRGAIFESWVASEILKHRRNAGESVGLSHYRDRHGAEVDLVVDRPAGPVLVEVKAARTVSPSLYSAAIRVADELSGEHRTEIVVVYGGDELQRRERVTLLPWDRIGDLTWI